MSTTKQTVSGDLLTLDATEREQLWKQVGDSLERYWREVENLPVAPPADPTELRKNISRFDFSDAIAPGEVVDFMVNGLTNYMAHVASPTYFGLFNPRAASMGVYADTLVAGFNPQSGSFSHCPFSVEIEQHLIRTFAGFYGFTGKSVSGSMTSGGTESNQTALTIALCNAVPNYRLRGLRDAGQPVVYASKQSHFSVVRACHVSSLGEESLRLIETDKHGSIIAAELERAIEADLAQGKLPVMVTATVGSTGAGAVDPVEEIVQICKKHSIWLHIDAAWAGPGILLSELHQYYKGVQQADSISLDAHKWLSVPMAAGMFITNRADAMSRTFAAETSYIPKNAHEEAIDPYLLAMQWSRRFIGLKLFASLAVAGLEGYRRALRHQIAMADELRERLASEGWLIVSQSPFPIVCFSRKSGTELADLSQLEEIANHVKQSGTAWISTTEVGQGLFALRACITNYASESKHIERLMQSLQSALEAVGL